MPAMSVTGPVAQRGCRRSTSGLAGQDRRRPGRLFPSPRPCHKPPEGL